MHARREVTFVGPEGLDLKQLLHAAKSLGFTLVGSREVKEEISKNSPVYVLFIDQAEIRKALGGKVESLST